MNSLKDAEQFVLDIPDVETVLIAGPTTSGKSSFALHLAERLNGVVINTDSMQVYHDLSVLSARPSEEEMKGIPHWLYGHVNGAVNYSVGQFVQDAERKLTEAQKNNLLPIFVGGTGLYFKALLEGLSPVPEVPDAIRESVRQWTDGKETRELYNEILCVDPKTAERLKSNDRLRIMRALEVYHATGRSLVDFHLYRDIGVLHGKKICKFFLSPEREATRKKIDARFLAMLSGGAIDEVRILEQRQLDPLFPVMRAHGVPGLIAYLRGQMSLENAILKGQGDTRRYAKRQMTWARHQMRDWIWVYK